LRHFLQLKNREVRGSVAKRLTESEKWKNSWFRNLQPRHKLLWIYLLDNCDQHGIWPIDMGLVSFQIGEPYDESDLYAFGGKLFFSANKAIIDSFLNFQYGGNKNKNSKTIEKGIKRIQDLVDFAESRKGNFFDNDDSETVQKLISNDDDDLQRGSRPPLEGVETCLGKGKGNGEGKGKGNKGEIKDPCAEHYKTGAKINEITKTVLELLNWLGDKNFKPNVGVKKQIEQLLNNNYTVEDMVYVINTKYTNWNGQLNQTGEPMMNFFTPKTLFNIEKFETYLNERPKE
jgi:uncharacterized phage protein (TIGR02220 family)